MNKVEYIRFAVMRGYADEEALDTIYSDNDFLTDLSKVDTGYPVEELEDRFTKQKGLKSIVKPPSTIYEGMIFMPIMNGLQSILGAVSSSNV